MQSDHGGPQAQTLRSIDASSRYGRAGYGLDGGARFVVPATRTMSEMLSDVRHWGTLEYLLVAIMVLQGWLTVSVFPRSDRWCGRGGNGTEAFSCSWSSAASVLLFLFWRASYNVGLGCLLRAQSQRAVINRWVARQSQRTRDRLWRWASSALTTPVSVSDKAAVTREADRRQLPLDYEAWMAFRLLATVVLVNDGWSYLLLCYRVFRWPAPSSAWHWCRPDLWAGYAVGAALLAFSYWAKMSAHRVVGDYAWYWGDFFFLMEGELTFDGVFELFPHPMYTVGYTGYYGLSLICRSYTLLVVSLMAHMSQLLFLMVVEEPHIQRTYEQGGLHGSTASGGHSDSTSRNSSSGRLPRIPEPIEKEPVVLANLDPFRNSDLSLLILALLTMVTPAISGWTVARRYYAVQVVAWMAFHWIGLGGVLYLQSSRRWWTRHFEQRGHSAAEAFRQWQRTCNMSLVLNHLVFIMMALYEAQPIRVPSIWALMSQRTAAVVGGAVLVLVGASSSVSAYRVLGDYGWFYGDFFLEPSGQTATLSPPPTAATRATSSSSSSSSTQSDPGAASPLSPVSCTRPSYTGIYRYLNNPDCVLGYLWQYGLSLAAASWRCFWFALCSQALHILFLILVEVPHMNRTYGCHCRHAAALELLVRRQVRRIREQPLVKEMACKVEARVDELRDRLRMVNFG